MRTMVLAFVAIICSSVSALEIPKGLTASDRREVIRTLGLNSAVKSLSNPYPLGGYSGMEFGYSVEFVNVRELRRLGCEPGSPGCLNDISAQDGEWRYSRLTLGKGLYHDVDVFFSFIPPVGEVRVSDFAAMLRWSFFQAKLQPINLSALLHSNQSNFNDVFMNRNIGVEILAGVNVDNFALYFGGGMIEAQGTFIGATPTNICQEDCSVDVGDTQLETASRTVTHRLREVHTVAGFTLHFRNLFAAAQVDRYRDAVYSFKLGLRF